MNVPDERPQWVAVIKHNITQQLAHGEFVVRERIEEIFGVTFGLAREKHVREALGELCEEGVTAYDGKVKKGEPKLPERTVTRGPKAPPLEPPTTSPTPDTET